MIDGFFVEMMIMMSGVIVVKIKNIMPAGTKFFLKKDASFFKVIGNKYNNVVLFFFKRLVVPFQGHLPV